MHNYWKPEHNIAIKQYYESQYIEDSDKVRRDIINTVLFKPLYEMAEIVLNTLDINNFNVNYEDYKQDIVLHLTTKVLPKIKKEKLLGSFQFLYVSARNYTLSYIINKKTNYSISIEKLEDNICEEVDLDRADKIAEIRSKIINEINLKLRGQTVINTTNSVFLLLLRQYIIDNDYDVRGFGDYVMDKMKLKLSTYRAIAGRLDIRTKVLNEKLINK